MKFLIKRFKPQETISLCLVMTLGDLMSRDVLDAESMSMFKILLGIREGHQRLVSRKVLNL